MLQLIPRPHAHPAHFIRIHTQQQQQGSRAKGSYAGVSRHWSKFLFERACVCLFVLSILLLFSCRHNVGDAAGADDAGVDTGR